MFEAAELGRSIPRDEFKAQVPALRTELLEIQRQLTNAPFPVIVVFAGVDGAGKGETVNLLNAWMDPRYLVTRAYGEPSDEERERPEYWRYWRDLPRKRRIGFFLSSWYSPPVLARVHRRCGAAAFDRQLDRIAAFERTLTDDGALILKFWMHLGKKAQRKRLRTLEEDPLTRWPVAKRQWEHWRMYDRFVADAERLVQRTSTVEAPWLDSRIDNTVSVAGPGIAQSNASAVALRELIVSAVAPCWALNTSPVPICLYNTGSNVGSTVQSVPASTVKSMPSNVAVGV
jgi:AMP-polyphosphate phosphotransferase